MQLVIIRICDMISLAIRFYVYRFGMRLSMSMYVILVLIDYLIGSFWSRDDQSSLMAPRERCDDSESWTIFVPYQIRQM